MAAKAQAEQAERAQQEAYDRQQAGFIEARARQAAQVGLGSIESFQAPLGCRAISRPGYWVKLLPHCLLPSDGTCSCCCGAGRPAHNPSAAPPASAQVEAAQRQGAAQLSQELQRQVLEKQARDSGLAKLYTNPPSEGFFAQFGTSHR